MEKQQILKHLTHVSGASAGAMTVSLLAVGMNATDFTKLVTDLDITKLLDNSGVFQVRARGVRFRNIMEIIYAQQIKERLDGIEPPQSQPEKAYYDLIQKKIAMIDRILKKAVITINNVDDIIKLSKNANALQLLDKEFAKLPKHLKHQDTQELVNSRITFSDLEDLRAILPEEKKHLIKNLSVVTTNQNSKQKQIHNSIIAGNDSIAEIVQQSAAHPLLFTPSINEKGHSVADGGILDNMPSEILIELFGLTAEQILCAKVEADSSFKARVEKAKQHTPIFISIFDEIIDAVATMLLGGMLITGRAEVLNREKIFHYLDNMIYLNSGKITAITTSLSPTERKKAIEDGYNQAEHFFKTRNKKFDTPLLPMLYLGRENLEQTLLTDEKDSKELFNAAGYAQVIFFLQSHIVDDIENDHFEHLPFIISQIHSVLTEDAKLNEVQVDQAMALILKQINFQCQGKLEKYLIEAIKTEKKAYMVNFFTNLLNLLYKPIEWVLSLFQVPTPMHAKQEGVKMEQSEDVQQDKKNKNPEEIYTALKVYGMFSKDEAPNTKQPPQKIVQDKTASDQQTTSSFSESDSNKIKPM